MVAMWELGGGGGAVGDLAVGDLGTAVGADGPA